MILIVKQAFLSAALLLLVVAASCSPSVIVVVDGTTTTTTTTTSSLRGGNKKQFLRAQRMVVEEENEDPSSRAARRLPVKSNKAGGLHDRDVVVATTTSFFRPATQQQPKAGPSLDDWKIKCIKPSGCSGAGDICMWCLKALATTSATENSSGVKHCADSMCGNCSAENIRPFFSCGLRLEYPERYYYPTDVTVIGGIDVEINAATAAAAAPADTEGTDVAATNADQTTAVAPSSDSLWDTVNCPAMYPGSGNDCVMIDGYPFKKCMYSEMGPSVSCQCSTAQPIWSCTGVSDTIIDEEKEGLLIVDAQPIIEIDDNSTMIDETPPVFEINDNSTIIDDGEMVVAENPVTQPAPVEDEMVVVETPITEPAPVKEMDEIIVENPVTQPAPVEEMDEVVFETPVVTQPAPVEEETPVVVIERVPVAEKEEIVNPLPETCPINMPTSSGIAATKCNIPSDELCCYSIQPSFAIVCNCDNKHSKFNCVIGVPNDCADDDQNPNIIMQPIQPPIIDAVVEESTEVDTIVEIDVSLTSAIQNAGLCPFEQPKQGLECSMDQLDDINCCYGNTSCVCSLSSYTQKYAFTCMSGSLSNCN
jgi:hypothetical protein